MSGIRDIRLKTTCKGCKDKCCNQPYDWVYIISEEIIRLEQVTGLSRSEFVVNRRNSNTGYSFSCLNLPCRFLELDSGYCTVYMNRPLFCQLFPFCPEPLTGYVCLLPAQCGVNLEIVSLESLDGLALIDYDEQLNSWLKRFWEEAMFPK